MFLIFIAAQHKMVVLADDIVRFSSIAILRCSARSAKFFFAEPPTPST